MQVKLEVRYEVGHSYEELWLKTELYCLHCGSKAVWVEDSEGDFYGGPRHLCFACKGWFLIYNSGTAEKDNLEDAQRLKAILREEANK